MEKLSLDAQAREHLERAAATSTGRSATTVYGGHGHTLRQTLLALTAGTSLAEHENPGEATLLVLRGHVRLTSGDTSWDGRTGDLIAIPPARHSLRGSRGRGGAPHRGQAPLTDRPGSPVALPSWTR